MEIFLIRDACTSPPKQVLRPSEFKKGKSGYGFSRSQGSAFSLNWKKKMWVEFNQLEHFRNGIPGHFPHDRMKSKLSLCTRPWFCSILSQEGHLHFPAAVPTLRNPGYCWACPSGESQILEHCFFKKVIRKVHADSILTLQHISTISKETIPWLFLFV